MVVGGDAVVVADLWRLGGLDAGSTGRRVTIGKGEASTDMTSSGSTGPGEARSASYG